ncbi:MAG TPA: type II toxin-antitoxin system VapC family toxin [Thermoanaerobaculia bacterium]|nr:type II toxin-antitoxin system VapC family toxin [Thermoanaerobaculia bacterium]
MIVIDTHVLVWWATSGRDQLSKAARRAIVDADSIAISVITAWEVGILSVRRRIDIGSRPNDWLRDVTEANRLTVLPVTIEIATLATTLHETLRDPMDCLIAATALTHSVPLVTKDERIQRSGVVATIW